MGTVVQQARSYAGLPAGIIMLLSDKDPEYSGMRIGLQRWLRWLRLQPARPEPEQRKNSLEHKPVSSPYISVEILSSPGIRRNLSPEAPQKLGEDAAGLRFGGGMIAGFVADGAPGPSISCSQNVVLNSRTVARSIGHEAFLPWVVERWRDKLFAGAPQLQEETKSYIENDFANFCKECMADLLLSAVREATVSSLSSTPDALPDEGENTSIQKTFSFQLSFTGFLYDLATHTVHVFQCGDTWGTVYVWDEATEAGTGTWRSLHPTNPPAFVTIGQDLQIDVTLRLGVHFVRGACALAVMSDGAYKSGAGYDVRQAFLESKQMHSVNDFIRFLQHQVVRSSDDKTLLTMHIETS